MQDLLPIDYLGVPPSEEDRCIVDDALQNIIARLNEVPKDRYLFFRTVCSVLLSVCCAQDDPASAFDSIGASVGSAILVILAKRNGS
jgi:hypothetical protein